MNTRPGPELEFRRLMARVRRLPTDERTQYRATLAALLRDLRRNLTARRPRLARPRTGGPR